MSEKKFSKSKTMLLVWFFLSLLLIAPLNTSAGEDHLSTGFGLGAREEHPEFALKLEFTLRAGNYLADVDVDIYQSGKKIKSIHSPAPWLFVDLNPGNYSVVATLDDGRKQGARFTITKGEQQKVILSWPGQE